MKRKQIILFATILLFAACTGTETTQEQEVQEQEQAKMQQVQTEIQEESQMQQNTLPSTITVETVNQYIPKGFRLVQKEDETDLLTGDFNGDDLEDFAIIMVSNDTENPQDAADARVVIFENDGTKFKEKVRSGNLGGFFVHQAPTTQLSLTKNVISLTFQGMRYDDEWKFRFDKKYDNYMLIGSEHNSYGNAVNDGSGNISTNYLSGVRLENLNKWDNQKEELIELPEKKIKVSKTLLPLSKFTENNYSDL